MSFLGQYIQGGYIDVAGLLGVDRNELRYATFNPTEYNVAMSILSEDPEWAYIINTVGDPILYNRVGDLFWHTQENNGYAELSWFENWVTEFEGMLLSDGIITEAELDQWWGEQDWVDDLGWNGAPDEPSVPQPPVIGSLSQEQVEKLVELYIGYFGRAAENEGLEFHTNDLLKLLQAGLSETEAFAVVTANFWQGALQYDEITGYSPDMSMQDFVAKVYANVLGRPDALETDQEGVDFWVNEMEQGRTQGEMVLQILDGAHHFNEQNPNDPISIYTGNLLENRIEISLFFAQHAISGDLNGSAAVVAGIDVMNRVDHTKESVAQVKNALLNGTLYDLPEIELVGASVLADELPIV